MVASGGIVVAGAGAASSQHFVMEASPFPTRNYNLIANGPAWERMGRPHTVHALGWITIGGHRMRWIYVPPTTPGSAMANHLALVWTATRHTYALSFHVLPPGGARMARALDIAVARHLVTVRPGA